MFWLSLRKMSNMEKKINRGIMYLCYFCLICGILLLLGDMGKFSYHPLVVLGNTLVVSGVLWINWGCRKPRLGRKKRKPEFIRQKEKRRTSFVFVLMLLYCLCFYRQRKMLDEQLHVLLLCLTKMEESTEDFTLLFSCFSFFLSLLCFFLIFVLKKGWLFYGITLFLLFLGPMFGYRPPWLVLFFLVFFHIGNGIYHAVYLKWNDEPEEKDSRGVVLEKGIFAAVAAVLLCFFLASLIPVGNRKEWMRDSVEFAHTWRKTVSSGEGTVLEGPLGKISRGNHYSSGSAQIEISLSEKPADRIYLKSFTGGVYRGDEWAEAEEKDYIPTWTSPQEEEPMSLSPAYFEWRQFELIQYGKLEDWKDVSSYPWLSQDYQEWSGMQKMKIRPLNGLQRTFFAPYLSVYTSRDAEGACHYLRFSWEDYQEYRQRMDEKPLQWFEQLEAPYREYARLHYLQVPEEKLPRLLALCRENPLEDPQDITAFIHQTLNQYAVYSQTPGFMPYGTDIAEYFLFDGQEGYCQHFATAAVLMYRMYGIPARYAAGYMADPGDFTQGQDEAYHATLTDQKAHAWVEIYLGGPGWIPIEVTPASPDGQGSGSGEGTAEPESLFFHARNWFNRRNNNEIRQETERMEETTGQMEAAGNKEAGQLNRIETAADVSEENFEEDWRENFSESGLDLQDEENVEKESQKDDGEEESLEKDSGSAAKNQAKRWKAVFFSLFRLIIAVAQIGIPAVLLLAGIAWAEEQLKKKKLERMGADEIYQNLVELFHLGGYLTEYDGTEPDFPQAAWKAGEQMGHLKNNTESLWSAEEIRKIKACAFQTAYGREISSDNEREQVIEAYQKIYRTLIKNQRGIKKLRIGIQSAVQVFCC